MREGPILFCGEMIRKVLSNDKTQTRRVVKNAAGAFWDHAGWSPQVEVGSIRWRPVDGDHAPYSMPVKCPYGSVGDRLWCRETFRETWDIDDRLVLEYRAGGTRMIRFDDRGQKIAEHGEHRITSVLPKWKPSIFMPRWASRITLEITAVRVELVQSISGRDVEAEGVEIDWDRVARMQQLSDVDPEANVRASYASLWDSINGKTYSWASNPWVWVVAFRPISAAEPVERIEVEAW